MSDQSQQETPQETVAQRLVQELRDADGTRINLQFQQGIINPMELAKLLGVRPQHIYGAIRDGRLKAVKQNNTQKLTIERGEAIRFASDYLVRKSGRILQREQFDALLEQMRQAS